MNQNQINRFWNKVDKKGINDCWLWKSNSKNKDGYGIVSLYKKPYAAHRIAFMLSNGDIPNGLLVCHKCDVPSCCNPNHLWLGTIADNNRDAREKGRSSKLAHYKGEKHPLCKISDVERENIKSLKYSPMSDGEIGKMLGISKSRVYEIRHGYN